MFFMFGNLKAFYKKHQVAIVISFIIAVIIFMNLFVYRFATDMIVIVLIILSLVMKKEKEFFRDWSLPIVLLYVYEFVRGKAYVIAGYFNRPLLTDTFVNVEEKLFSINGKIPTVFLQYSLSDGYSGDFNPNWYDIVLFLFYTSFFWFWLVVGFFIWRKSGDLFKRYMAGLIGFSLIDNLVYIWFPSAPPWYASKIGLLPPLQRLMLNYDFFKAKYTTLVDAYGNNDFAAFPSHHAAWAFYAALFVVGVFGKKWLPIFIVPLLIAFATWYGAEHYVIDSLAGIMVATVAYIVVMNIKRSKNEKDTN